MMSIMNEKYIDEINEKET